MMASIFSGPTISIVGESFRILDNSQKTAQKHQ